MATSSLSDGKDNSQKIYKEDKNNPFFTENMLTISSTDENNDPTENIEDEAKLKNRLESSNIPSSVDPSICRPCCIIL